MMNIALLIDLDNLKNEASLSRLFAELPTSGEIIFKFGFYSDFKDKKCESLFLTNGIVPVMVPAFSKGKSCSDISLATKAMDILYKNRNVDCFAIASNDSDFAALSIRLRKNNKKTILITDKQIVNKEQFSYFDETINIYDLLNPKVGNNEPLTSNQELPTIAGEENETAEETKSQSMSLRDSIVTNVDNIQHVDYSNEPDDNIRELLSRIDVAFRNINIENDYARLSSLIEFLNKDGKKFNPKDYGHINGNAKDFFEKRLNKYMQLESKGQEAFVKFKEGMI